MAATKRKSSRPTSAKTKRGKSSNGKSNGVTRARAAKHKLPVILPPIPEGDPFVPAQFPNSSNWIKRLGLVWGKHVKWQHGVRGGHIGVRILIRRTLKEWFLAPHGVDVEAGERYFTYDEIGAFGLTYPQVQREYSLGRLPARRVLRLRSGER